MHTSSPLRRRPLALTLALGAIIPLAIGLAACTEAPAATVAGDTEAVTHDENDRVPEGAAWTQHYFSSAPGLDGEEVELHADVLLPDDLDEGEQVPVILSVGSYFGHSGEITDEDWTHPGPSDRFADLIEGGDLFDERYAFVMVDLRGFGGSTGCLDFMGDGEQADVAAAIEWAASQPWSTGDVGMYGKSYDAITGIVGTVLEPESLRAVVAQAPIWDMYRNNRSGGVPRLPLTVAVQTYNEIAALEQLPADTERYRENAAYEQSHPECVAINTLSAQTADPASPYWTSRDFAARVDGSTTPLLFTQGWAEWNTESEAMEEFLANHEGPVRGWFGPWDHIRGNEVDEDGTVETGREGWFDEVMAFYDEHLKGVEPTEEHPAFVIQDNMGSWRAQDDWPLVDAAVDLSLEGGSYLDDGAEGDPTVDTGNRFVQTSAPVSADTRFTGTPSMSLTSEGHGNLMVKLYDVAPDGTAVLINEQVAAVTPGEVTLEMKAGDWWLAAGHALAVQIGTIEAGPLSDWIDTPSNERVAVSDVQLQLALQDPAADVDIPGERALYLDSYLAISTATLPEAPTTFTIDGAEGGTSSGGE
ncbi:CocE/NonD family hydrolase [Microbacterium invictum]|uniref:CocE/NonD family hydrolase n=1 Tax=Microbacterium invictum TaxID=515415 RepID=A0ABZ0V8C0_9MICO|nr:CocE/NonD family hydrolase [Microbacterium invictum]WQB69852.1 CocE/NonD family hydrolase [Microbacterium invictum]